MTSSPLSEISETKVLKETMNACFDCKMNGNKRSVRFSNQDNDVCLIPSPLYRLDTLDEIKALWYSGSESNQMLLDASRLCHKMERKNEKQMTKEYQKYGSICQQQQTSSNCTMSTFFGKEIPLLAFDCTTRGLEFRVCAERQRRRAVTVKFIQHAATMLYQNNNNKNIVDSKDEDNEIDNVPIAFESSIIDYDEISLTLSKISMKCTEWATNLAIEEASRDYIRAYGFFDNIIENSKTYGNTADTATIRQRSNHQTKRKQIDNDDINTSSFQINNNKRSRQTEYYSL